MAGSKLDEIKMDPAGLDPPRRELSETGRGFAVDLLVRASLQRQSDPDVLGAMAPSFEAGKSVASDAMQSQREPEAMFAPSSLGFHTRRPRRPGPRGVAAKRCSPRLLLVAENRPRRGGGVDREASRVR